MGKSTQVKLLSRKLAEFRVPFLQTKEPGGSALGQELRRILLDLKYLKLDPEAQLCLLLAARHHHIHHVIRPALAQGEWVLCDRFIHSSLVYQGIIQGVGVEKVLKMHELCDALLIPDMTFVLQEDVTISKRRCERRFYANHWDQETLECHQKIADAYLEFSDCIFLEKGRSVKQTHRRIWGYVEEYI